MSIWTRNLETWTKNFANYCSICPRLASSPCPHWILNGMGIEVAKMQMASSVIEPASWEQQFTFIATGAKQLLRERRCWSTDTTEAKDESLFRW